MTIDELEARMEAATARFCKTRVPTGETGKYPAVPEGASISGAEIEMEQATQTFLQSDHE